MYKYFLPSGAEIDIDRVVDAVLFEDAYPQIYLDIETGAFVEITSADNFRRWVNTTSRSEKFFLIERFDDEDRNAIARDFVTTLLQDMSLEDTPDAQKALARGGWRRLEEFLEKQTDGWIYAWNQYLGDQAWEYAHRWLTEHPHVSIKVEFEGCGDCAICKLVREGNDDNRALLSDAFTTQQIMHNVEMQLQKHSKSMQEPTEKKMTSKATERKGKKSRGFEKVFSFKITLTDSRPAIWRRILIPSDVTFFELHCAIQDAMGWFDTHLHQFRMTTSRQSKAKRRDGADATTYITFPSPETDEWDMLTQTKDERTEKIADWFPSRMKQCVYEYDFGDGWTHTVLFEREIERSPKEVYPQCTAGKNACPPEDCGGLGGYIRLQKIIKNPKHKEHADVLAWLGLEDANEFNSSHFDPTKVVFEDPELILKEYEWRFDM